jgi:hypothetical protein
VAADDTILSESVSYELVVGRATCRNMRDEGDCVDLGKLTVGTDSFFLRARRKRGKNGHPNTPNENKPIPRRGV